MKKSIVVIMSPLILSNAFADDNMPKSMSEVSGKVPFLTLTAEEAYTANAKIHPFINSSLDRPTTYDGGFFELNHEYPSEIKKPTEPYPWKAVTKGKEITKANAYDYVMALKAYVADDMRALIFDRNNPNNSDWYQSIWLGTEREPIHGMYVGSGFPAHALTDQNLDLTTYVYTLYDKTAAKTLGDIWGVDLKSAMNPTLSEKTTQYAEGSVIVKFSFVTPCGSDWSPMENTAIWQIYAPVNISNGTAKSADSTCKNRGAEGDGSTPVLTNVYLMQFDIIVKDTQAAPDTGWVFSTLVYDKDAKGSDAWDRMVPLGATWGGDPDVINVEPSALTPPASVNPKLQENWINEETPAYARSTLGWDGRLSGPNDGAVVTPAWAAGKYYHKGLSSAGCLACHSSAQYPMTAFLLPSTTYPPQTQKAPLSSDPSSASLVLAEPGSDLWMQWFQSRSGSTPMGPKDKDGNEPIALDYDMVTAFKAIPMWQAAVKAASN
ncbi:hypothetical protein ACQUQP_04770 [Marinobacterium sp. YM272]|uniref:hypothetical protein n=1 Tax=Marinobacterium sp. YM272 TaxID=3421654 RepID=UPI003D7FC8E5